MPTLNSYVNDPGYYIRAWTSNLGNINYKLRPEGWTIIDEWDDLPSDGEISWQHVNALKSIGVVYTDDTGVIYPDDEKFQPDPDQITTTELPEDATRSFFEAIRSTCNLSPEQLSELCYILGVEQPTDEIEAQFEPAVEAIKTNLKTGLADGTIPVTYTLPLSPAETFFLPTPDRDNPTRDDVKVIGFFAGPEDIERGDPEFEEGYDKNTLGMILVGPSPSGEKIRDFIMHYVFFDEHRLTAWTIVTSRELSWDVRSELFAQISALLPQIVEALSEVDTQIDQQPTDFDISISHKSLGIKSV